MSINGDEDSVAALGLLYEYYKVRRLCSFENLPKAIRTSIQTYGGNHVVFERGIFCAYIFPQVRGSVIRGLSYKIDLISVW